VFSCTPASSLRILMMYRTQQAMIAENNMSVISFHLGISFAIKPD
jgi:hypothetical protein